MSRTLQHKQAVPDPSCHEQLHREARRYRRSPHSVLIETGEAIRKSKSWSSSFAKRFMDFTVSLLVLVGASVVGVCIYLLVRATSKGPGLLRQQRVGYRGRLFTLYKFRTMEITQNGAGPCLTRQGDPRVTAMGNLLRRLKMDELPQFYNVMRGKMSLVGPRPKLPQYSVSTDALYRPGITGFATLLFRGEEQLLKHISQDELDHFYERRIKPLKARADLQYMRKATFFSDMQILFLTVFASLSPSARVVRKKHPIGHFVPEQQTAQRRGLEIEFE